MKVHLLDPQGKVIVQHFRLRGTQELTNLIMERYFHCKFINVSK